MVSSGGDEASASDADHAGAPDEDDLTIPGDAVLWRRVPPHWYTRHPDGTCEVWSAAFSDHELSADLASIAGSPEITRGAYVDCGVVEIQVAVLRAEGQRVRRDPLPDNEAHVLVLGHKGKSLRRRLRDRARWVIQP